MKNPKILLAAFIVLFIVMTVFSIIAYSYNNEWKHSNAILVHTNKVLYKSERTLSFLKDVEMGTRGFALTGDSIFLQPYTQSKDSILRSIAELQALTSDNTDQQKVMNALSLLTGKRLQICEDVQSSRKRNDYELEEIKILLVNGKKIMDSIRSFILALQIQENELLSDRDQANRYNNRNAETGMLILLSGLLILLIAAYFAAQYFSKLRKNDSNTLTQLNSKLIFFTKQMDDIVKGISDPFFALDKKFNFIFLNDAVKNSIGLGKGDMIGKNFFEMFPQYKLSVAGARLQEAMEAKCTISFEAYEDFLDQWQDISIYPTSEGVSVIVKDATKRKNAENAEHTLKKMLEETSEVAKVGGWEVDMIKNTVRWSQVNIMIHQAATDYIPDIRKSISFYKAGHSRETFIQLLNNAIEHGEEWDAELQIITTNGNEKWIRSKGKPVFEADECVRIFGSNQDINAERKMDALPELVACPINTYESLAKEMFSGGSGNQKLEIVSRESSIGDCHK
ncbi:MAG: CHASE3 domain-containing protein [Ferruginibacter sp.]